MKEKARAQQLGILSIQSRGDRLNKIIQEAIEITPQFTDTLRHYGEKFIVIKIQLNIEEQRVITIIMDTNRYLQDFEDISAPPENPQPMSFRQYIDNLISDSEASATTASTHATL
jgi:hypothetical protein